MIRVSAEPAGHAGDAGHIGDAGDVIESAPSRLSWRRSRTAGTAWPATVRPATAWAVAAALIAGGVAGYLVGVSHSGSAGASPSASPTPAVHPVEPALFGTGHRCSVQLGNRLQLGVELVNSSGTSATITNVDTNLPLGGLRQLDAALGSCGALAAARATGYRLAPDATAWVTATFEVLESCPGPIPVTFVLAYEQAGRVDNAALPEFPDLGDVPYSGCSPSASR